MTMDSAAGHAMRPTPPAGRHRLRSRLINTLAVVLTIVIAISCSCGGGLFGIQVLFTGFWPTAAYYSAPLKQISYIHSETQQDIPNIWWGLYNGTFSYLPTEGPPSSQLFVHRPDVVFVQYLKDYVRAGIPGCNAPYQTYSDPAAAGILCHVPLPITNITAVYVIVGPEQICGDLCHTVPAATIMLQITSASGQVTNETVDDVRADAAQPYYNTYLHMDAWWGWASRDLYTQILHSAPPPGLEFLN